MKSYVATALFATLALALFSSCSADEGSLFVGHRQPSDHLLQQEMVEKDTNYLTTRSKTVTLTGDGVSRITRVEVIDTKNSNNNYTPKILSGGPEYSFVTVKIQSKRGHGLHYLIKIFGR